MNETTGTERQLGLGQMGLLRIRDRSTVANRCSHRTTVGDFGLNGPYEHDLSPHRFLWSGGFNRMYPLVTSVQFFYALSHEKGGESSFFEDDGAVTGDWELQDWVNDVFTNGFGKMTGLKIPSLGFPPRLASKQELVMYLHM